MSLADAVPLNERQRYWLEHVEACARSGQTMRAYAESQGLSVQTLYSWKQQLRQSGALAPASRTPVSTGTSPRFQRLEVIPGVDATHCRIELPNGVVVNWPVEADSQALGVIISALRG